MTTHELKCWPVPYGALFDRSKTHEIRKSDRNYQVGDVLRMREWKPSVHTEGDDGEYTGAELAVVVTYITRGPAWGLAADLCVMSVRRVDEP